MHRTGGLAPYVVHWTGWMFGRRRGTGKSEGFTHIFVVTFKNEADRDAYIAHPAHEEFVKVVRDRREKVVVIDYWAP